MFKIQKHTYTKIILSKIYSENCFAAKSVTLDFLYNFENPCQAILELTNALNTDKELAKIGLNCIMGVIMAIEDFSHLMPTIINFRFVETVIKVVDYRIGDTTLQEYSKCMSKILEFISINIDLRQLNQFFSLISVFKYCDLKNEENEKVFRLYCDSLNKACSMLKRNKDEVFDYYFSKISMQYLIEPGKREENLKDFYIILENYLQANLFIYSNDEDLSNKIQGHLKNINVKRTVIRIDNIKEIIENKEREGIFIFIINFAIDGYKEMLYFLGLMQSDTEKKKTYVKFENIEKISTNPALMYIVDRNNMAEEKLLELLRTDTF